jgi:hypothetical protein
VLGILAKGRAAFTTDEWRDFLIRSIGIEPTALDERGKMVVLLRMTPFVERNFNLVELGPRGTGKSHLFQQISPYSHLISGGKATVAKMFVNNGNGQRGLVCQYDVVCFDEVAGVSFDQKDGVNILKGYMASGEFSRGKESIRAEGGIAMVSNFDVDVEQQQRSGHPRLRRRGGWQGIIQLPQTAGIGLGVTGPKPCSSNPVLQALGTGSMHGRWASGQAGEVGHREAAIAAEHLVEGGSAGGQLVEGGGAVEHVVGGPDQALLAGAVVGDGPEHHPPQAGRFDIGSLAGNRGCSLDRTPDLAC